MPLKEFIEETIKVLGTDAEEILVEQAKPFRNNPGPNEGALVTQFNDMMVAVPSWEMRNIHRRVARKTAHAAASGIGARL
jgi:hypothetical protein